MIKIGFILKIHHKKHPSVVVNNFAHDMSNFTQNMTSKMNNITHN